MEVPGRQDMCFYTFNDFNITSMSQLSLVLLKSYIVKNPIEDEGSFR